LFIVFDESKNISENFGKSQLKMGSPGIIWDTGQVARISAINPNFNETFVFFRFVDIIDITVHDRFWNVGQANCILKYFENMIIDHSDSTIF
jgi:hypothetical protein